MTVDGLDAPGVQGVLDRMLAELTRMERDGDPRRFFHGTYSRTTRAVGEAISDARFEDPA